MIEAKVTIKDNSNCFLRKRVSDSIKENLEWNQILFLCGVKGSGKTIAVRDFLKCETGCRKSYLKLDFHDNEMKVFEAYFGRLMHSVGIDVPDIQLSEMMDLALETLGKTDENYIFVFDEVQELENLCILKEMAWFLSYLPERCRVILISDDRIPDIFWKWVLSNKILLFPMDELVFNDQEMAALFQDEKLALTSEQIRDLILTTGGIPGAVSLVKNYETDSKGLRRGSKNWNLPILQKFYEDNIWKSCTEAEQELLLAGSSFSFITEAFCAEVLKLKVDHGLLFELYCKGFLGYDADGERYWVKEYLAAFIQHFKENVIDSECCRSAAEWYTLEGNSYEALHMIGRMGDRRLLEGYLIKHAKVLPHMLSESELISYLEKVEEEPQDFRLLYLSGVLAIWQEDKKKYKKVIGILEKSYERSSENRRELGEILLNLYYEDPQISAKEWMNRAGEYINEIGSIRLYRVTGDVPSIRCGTKDLSELFSGGQAEEKRYKRQWSEILSGSQKKLIDAASIDYLLETNRREQAEKEFQELLLGIDDTENVSLLFGMFGIADKLKKDSAGKIEYHEIESRIFDMVKSRDYRFAVNNLDARIKLTEAFMGNKEPLTHWMIYLAPNNFEKITRENVYLLYVKARGLLLIGQYGRARPLLRKLGEYYERKNQNSRSSACCFGEAVAIYKSGEKELAIKKAAQALSKGAPFRYIEIYTEYGAAGAELIQEYQKLIFSGKKSNRKEKKKYYYGNVLRADFEGYQNMLLRCAKREARNTKGINEGKSRGETLTMTETTVLQYIEKGFTNQEISDYMKVKLTTIKTHIYSIYRKLGVKSRVAAVNKGKELRIL